MAACLPPLFRVGEEFSIVLWFTFQAQTHDFTQGEGGGKMFALRIFFVYYLKVYRSAENVISIVLKKLPELYWKCYQLYRVMKVVLKKVTIALLKILPEIYWKCYQLDILRFYCSSGFLKLCHQSVFCTSRVPSSVLHKFNHNCAKCFKYYQLLCFIS